MHSGTDAGGAEIGGTSAEVIRAIAALVRVDPAYDRVLRRRAVLEREASGLTVAAVALGDMQRTLATNGGVRPSAELTDDAALKAQRAREAVNGVEHEIADLEATRAPADQVAPLKQGLADLRDAARQGCGRRGRLELSGRRVRWRRPAGLAAQRRGQGRRAPGADRDGPEGPGDSESSLAKDALHRLDLRLSRLLRRARLGRIESVLGRKRALEVEIEAIRLGYLPQDAVDSLEAARYLEDNEEYWPFEGDDWPDEYVGGETK